jgi:hypothetical protein
MGDAFRDSVAGPVHDRNGERATKATVREHWRDFVQRSLTTGYKNTTQRGKLDLLNQQLPVNIWPPESNQPSLYWRSLTNSRK